MLVAEVTCAYDELKSPKCNLIPEWIWCVTYIMSYYLYMYHFYNLLIPIITLTEILELCTAQDSFCFSYLYKVSTANWSCAKTSRSQMPNSNKLAQRKHLKNFSTFWKSLFKVSNYWKNQQTNKQTKRITKHKQKTNSIIQLLWFMRANKTQTFLLRN